MSTLKLSLVGFGARLTIMAVSMLNTILLARLLGPWEYGEYALLLVVVSVLTVLADFGMSQTANVFFGHHEEWGARIHGFLVRFVLVSSMIVSILGAGILWVAGDTLLPNFPQALAWIAFAALPMALYANFWNGMMIGMGRIWQYNLLLVTISALSLLLTLVFVVGLSGGVIVAATNYLVAMLVHSIVALIIAFRVTSGCTVKESPTELPQQMLRFGLRGYPNSIATLLFARIPVFLLNAVHGTAAVGIFSVAQQLVEKMLFPTQAVQDVAYRKMSTLPNRAATLTMNRYVRLDLWGMLVMILVVIVLAPWIIVLLLGEAYAESGQVLRVLLFGTVVMGIPLLLSAYFLNQLRRPGLLSILAWMNMLLNLLLGLLFIPTFSEIGAALALTLTQVLGTVIVLVLYLRMARTRVRELIRIDKEDIALIREQLAALLWWRGSRE